jgi:hypothetical protein
MQKALVPTGGCLKLPTGNRSELRLSRTAEAVPEKKVFAAQRVVSNYLVNLPEVFRVFRKFQSKIQNE